MRYLLALMLIACVALAGDEAKPLVDAGSPLSVATEHIVAYWSFDGGSLRDTSGNGNDGTAVGGVDETEGIGSGAMMFDGDGDYVLVNNVLDLSSQTSVTISAWMKKGSIDSLSGIMLGTKASGKIEIRNQYLADGWMAWTASPNEAEYAYARMSATDSVIDDKWYHIVGIFENNNADIYIDGSRVTEDEVISGTPTFAEKTGAYADNLYLGAGSQINTPNIFFEGSIDEVLIYNKALSPAEIRQLYNIGLHRLRGDK